MSKRGHSDKLTGESKPADGLGVEIGRYLEFCREHKGLAAGTVKQTGSGLGRFQLFLQEQGVAQWLQLNSEHLDGFVLQQAPGPMPQEGEARRRHARRIQALHSRLRGFLRYLFSQSAVDRDWALALRSPRRYRLAATPRPLPLDQVLRVLGSIDRAVAPGKRDFALLLLAAGLGLRAGDLAALRLERFGWRRQVVWIEQTKTGNFLELPLSGPLSQALADYLLQERPSDTPCRGVFLRSRPPWAPLSAAGISVVMAQRLRQAGVQGSGHQLRHTLASELLAAGVSFSTLQELLGHRQITSTQVYTKIDLRQLREVADNDAGGY